MRALVIIACLFVCQQAAAWPWSNRQDPNTEEIQIPTGIIQAQGDGSEMAECLQAGQEGRCEFYSCLDRRFDCTTAGFTNQISKHFCKKIDDSFDTFNTFGQKWLNSTSVCLMRPMLTIYSGESTTCSAIREAGIQAILTCNQQQVEGQNFCDFITGNALQYAGLMGREELAKLRSLNNNAIWTNMVTDSLQCGGEILANAWGNLMSAISNVGQSLARGIANLFTWN